MHRHLHTARLLPLALTLVVFACKKQDAAPVDTASSMAPVPPPAAAGLHVTGVETGKGVNADRTIKDDNHDFGVRDTIYASVSTEGSGSGKLAAKWSYQDGKVVNEESQDISPTGDAHHEFHITKPSAWPKGNYKVDITLDGAAVGSKDFTVK
ncbi:MAG TPA: hypothetical protein VM099_06745 [Gemmatimonadaceae bacterium]|nr:hypothetical protein [Gemmatimonadaceae bacterium]